MRVTPNAPRYSLREGKGAVLVSVKEAAQGGRANDAVITLIAKHLKVPRYKVDIVSGHTRPVKMVGVWK